jgi:hypothetical protein
MALRSTATATFDFTGISAGITAISLIPPGVAADDEAIYINNVWARSHAVGVTIDPITSMLEVGLCPDQTVFPGLTRTSSYWTNFTGFVVGFADPVFRNPVRWFEPSVFAYVRWQGPTLSAVRWHMDIVVSFTTSKKPITETGFVLPLTPMPIWPVVSTQQQANV